jgi:hypothetical protein
LYECYCDGPSQRGPSPKTRKITLDAAPQVMNKTNNKAPAHVHNAPIIRNLWFGN